MEAMIIGGTEARKDETTVCKPFAELVAAKKAGKRESLPLNED